MRLPLAIGSRAIFLLFHIREFSLPQTRLLFIDGARCLLALKYCNAIVQQLSQMTAAMELHQQRIFGPILLLTPLY
jgi:hypothetical protein